MTTPKDTIAMLRELLDLGFTNEQFRVVHHMSNASIQSHLSYCEGQTEFREDGTNAKVAQRLSLILRSYQQGGFKSPENRPAVLRLLAHAAVAEIPK